MTVSPCLPRPISSSPRARCCRRHNNLGSESSSGPLSPCLPPYVLACVRIGVLSNLSYLLAPVPLEPADDEPLHRIASSPERPCAFQGPLNNDNLVEVVALYPCRRTRCGPEPTNLPGCRLPSRPIVYSYTCVPREQDSTVVDCMARLCVPGRTAPGTSSSTSAQH